MKVKNMTEAEAAWLTAKAEEVRYTLEDAIVNLKKELHKVQILLTALECPNVKKMHDTLEKQ